MHLGKRIKQYVANQFTNGLSFGTMLFGLTSAGRAVPVQVADDGTVATSGGGGSSSTIIQGTGGTSLDSNGSGALMVQQTVSGYTTTVVCSEITRPNNTTPYAISDVVGDGSVGVITNIARSSGGTGYLVKFKLATDQSTCVASFKIHIYNVSPTAIDDNAPFTQLYSNQSSYIGYVTMANFSTEGAGSTAAVTLNISDRLAYATSGSDDLFYIMETNSIFTPAANQKFLLTATAENN